MSSAINDANPEQGNATTASVRANFTAAKTEINNFERMTEDKVVTAGSADAQTANFSNDVTLAEGVRITVEIGSGLTTTSATPTLDVDGTGPKTIVRQDGSALVAGDLKAGQYCDLIYDATATKWVWLNSVSESPNLVSPALSGTPTAPTAATDTNTTQVATTAFVQSNIAVDASDTVKGIVELATAAEVKAGTDTSRVLTAATLLRVAVSNGAVASAGDQGSIEIAGVIIKWGLMHSSTDSEEAFTFSTAFPTGCSCVVTQRIGTNKDQILSVTTVSASTFRIDRAGSIDDGDFYFIAIGR